MNCHIRYAAVCHTGKLRKANQDNLWAHGTYLPCINDGLLHPLAGKLAPGALFAVFDGMGGESHGETAAFLAAQTFDAMQKQSPAEDMAAFLHSAFLQMNDAVCAYGAQHKISRMGTTAAVIAFGEKNITIANIGDSKVYRRQDDTLTQLSEDHIAEMAHLKKAPLTQHLGIHKTEFVISPYYTTDTYRDSTRYLLCSDGLTDMISPEEINDILSVYDETQETVNCLLQCALDNGGADNITVILCDVIKEKGFFGRLFGR